MLFSVLFRSAATAALVTLGLWLFITLIWPALAPAIAEAIVPADSQEALVVTAQILSRLSPSTLYGESILALLDPTTRMLGPLYLSQLQGAVIGAPLSAVGQRDGRLAADRRFDRGEHPAVRRRLYRFPAAGGASIAHTVNAKSG